VEYLEGHRTLWARGSMETLCSDTSLRRRLLFLRSQREEGEGKKGKQESSIHVSFTASVSGPNLCFFLMNTCGTVKLKCTHTHTQTHSHTASTVTTAHTLCLHQSTEPARCRSCRRILSASSIPLIAGVLLDSKINSRCIGPELQCTCQKWANSPTR